LETFPGQKVTLFNALTSRDPADLVRYIISRPEAPALLENERLEPLVDWKLGQSSLAQGLHIQTRGALKEKRREEARWELIQTAPLLELLEATAALKPKALKGLDFRTRLYPPATRTAFDIDLYLERHKFTEFAQTAEKLGWRLATRGAFGRMLWRRWNHLVWVKGRTILEVHYALTAPGRYNAAYRFGGDPIPLDLQGITLWVPQKEEAALFSLVHLCGNHFFAPHLLSVYDIWLLSPELDWCKLFGLARRAGLERTVSFALAYLRNYPTLKKRIPPGEPLKPGRIGKRFLKQSPQRVQTRSRLLGLYLADPPYRGLTYLLGHLWNRVTPR
jgi:hypothetical protein